MRIELLDELFSLLSGRAAAGAVSIVVPVTCGADALHRVLLLLMLRMGHLRGWQSKLPMHPPLQCIVGGVPSKYLNFAYI